MTEVGLGTVQLGIPYGNRSKQGVLSEETALDILRSAITNKIKFFDTAPEYGEAESRLGNFFDSHTSSIIEISTKLPATSKEIWSSKVEYLNFAVNSITNSLTRLRVKRVAFLQLHQSGVDFLSSSIISDVMSALIERGLCDQIGVSVYLPEEAELASSLSWVSALQIPVNLLDHRFVSPELLRKYSERKIRVIGRSLFLQGLLVEAAPLPDVRRKNELVELRSEATALTKGHILQELALRYVFRNLSSKLDIALIGVDSVPALLQNLKIVHDGIDEVPTSLLEGFKNLGERAAKAGLLNPGNWL